jgi:hypothetical protein
MSIVAEHADHRTVRRIKTKNQKRARPGKFQLPDINQVVLEIVNTIKDRRYGPSLKKSAKKQSETGE